MSPRLSDRISAARRHRFIGRVAEQALFESAISADDLPFNVLHVYGPGGVGKTSLLRQFAEISQSHGAAAYSIDARNTEPAPDSFLAALSMAMGSNPAESPADVLAQRKARAVILVDTFEKLSPLEDWLRDGFLPRLPESVLVVLAGRNPLSSTWRADPGWQPFLRSVALRNLSPEEGRSYLKQRNLPADELQSVLDFTHSYPLALSLVADMYDQRPDFRFMPAAAPDVIKMLLEQFLQRVPGPAHRAALEACALVRVMTESLLAEMLNMPEPNDLFDWLRSLSFIETRPGGLFPHDLARDALVVDLRWRNPEWYGEMHRRARAHYTQRLQSTNGPEQQLALFDLVFLHRDNPMVRPFFEWQTSGRMLPDMLRDADGSVLLDMVSRLEGPQSAHLAAQLFEQQPENVIVFRDGEGQATGFLTLINLNRLNAADREQDQAFVSAWRYLRQRRAPLRAGESATYFRFWMADDTYQGVSPTQSLIFINMVRHYLTTPGLAFTFIPCADPDFWTEVFAYADLARLPDADFEIDGRRFGVYGHDWRATPPAAWLELLAERETALAPETIQPPPPEERLVVLSAEEFGDAVINGLREMSRPGGLRDNPLLRSRLVVQRAGSDSGESQRNTALDELLREAVANLQMSPKDLKYYRAVYHTYVQPAATQELAAELLDLPFSTYRRHLKTGITLVTEMLWQAELDT